MSAGLLLFAHGARDPRWAEPFVAIAARIRARRPAPPVELAFLEFMAPDLGEAARRLAAGGCTRIDVVPLFLGAGRPRAQGPAAAARGAARPRCPASRFTLHPAIGENDAVIAVVASAASPRPASVNNPRLRVRVPVRRAIRPSRRQPLAMNLHQFRFVQEAVRRDLNLTETAKALYTSQPGVCKAILELEDELGIDIFARHGKRLRRVTEPGSEVLKSIEIIMREVGNLKRIGEEFSQQDAGTLSIATTHTQARYVLPEPVALLRRRYPKVKISLHQGTPEQVAQMLLEEVADIGLATESLTNFDELVTLPCYEWQHVLVVPAGHPLAQRRAAHARGPGAAAADLLPPVVHRPEAHRRGPSPPAS